MSALHLTNRAEEDLGGIFAHMAHTFRFFGEDAAKSYCEGLKDELDQLARSPMSGRAEPAIDGRVRSLLFRRHIIYYEPDGDGILVLRVLPEAG